MRPTEEKRQQTIKTYLKLLRELKRKREIRGITSVVYRHGLHLTASAAMQELGILDKYAHEYTWIYSGKVDEKLAEKVYQRVVEKMTKRVLSARDKAINKPESIRDYEPPHKFKQRYDFARLHGFGEHSPISKMIKSLGNGNYIYGHRLFERKFKEYCVNKFFNISEDSKLAKWLHGSDEKKKIMPSYIQIIAHYKPNHFDREAIGLIMFDEEKVIYRFKKIKNKMVKNVVKYYNFEGYNMSKAIYSRNYQNGLVQFEDPKPVASEISEEKFNQLFGVLIN